MSVWGELGKAVNSTIQTGNIVPLDEMIESVKTPGAVRLVKSVQRGTTGGTKVTISSVNTEKSIVLIAGWGGGAYLDVGDYGDYRVTVGGAYVSSFTSTSITFESVDEMISWQVIEFY